MTSAANPTTQAARSRQPAFGESARDRRAANAIRRAADYLLAAQHSEGYWQGELESNPTMEAEYVMLTRFLGLSAPEKLRKLRRQLLHSQREDGAWGQFYGSPGDLSTSVECYFALKLCGMAADDPRMAAAREFILSRGGVCETRVFTKIWLSLFGQFEWKGVPILPAELMLLPSWFPINLYEFSSWARATIAPLLILFDIKPTRELPDSESVDELYPLPRSEIDYSLKRPERLIGWDALFYAADAALKRLERLPWKPTRAQAVRKAERWIVERQEADGSWGGIQPPWVYSLMALHELGYPLDHPVMRRGIEGFEAFSVEEDGRLRVQACVSPVWDTGLALIALLDAGMDPRSPALVRAGEWLVNAQVLTGGDWQVKASDTPPGGWAFEFHNNHYPDIDDTAEIAIALSRMSLPDDAGRRRAMERAARWLLGMQSANGGWAAFDKDNTRALLAKLPFSDFGETIDPPSADVTAHVLEALRHLGYDAEHPQMAKATRYLLDEQEEDGSWFGRWGVNYIYGTGAALPALAAQGMDMSAEPARRAVRWLTSRQNADGGWGESCISYVDERHKGVGHSAASQTAWALIALIAADETRHPATERGVDYLIASQRADGGWDEPYFTGAGFPGYGVGRRPDALPEEDAAHELSAGFMINYHMYRNYWPLMALGRYAASRKGAARAATASRLSDAPNSPRAAPKRLRKMIKLW